MFELIPKIFYNQDHCHFGQSFNTINIFIYYGANTLANAPKAIQAIIEMAVANMTQK